jgi:hypothetical protein
MYLKKPNPLRKQLKKSYATYELVGFPVNYFGTFSDGQTFEIELYKAAN